jgi:hypothetical protein
MLTQRRNREGNENVMGTNDGGRKNEQETVLY